MKPMVTLMYSHSAQEADLALCRSEDGVERALLYAKMWCRYAKDILSWMEKRISLGKSTCSSEKQIITTESVVPVFRHLCLPHFVYT